MRHLTRQPDARYRSRDKALMRWRREQRAQHRQEVAEWLADLEMSLASDLDRARWKTRLEETVERRLRLTRAWAQMVRALPASADRVAKGESALGQGP